MVALTPDDAGVDVVLGGQRVARYEFSPEMTAFESPRPLLDDIRTASGVLVSDAAPADHTWHRGLSLALAYVGPSNLWGGGSFVPELGEYREIGNNGSMRHLSAAVDGATITERLAWLTETGERLATEQRTLRFSATDRDWGVEWVTEVTAARELAFGSPATHGRIGAGYSGIFFRLSPAFKGGTLVHDAGETDDDEAIIGTHRTALAVRSADGAAQVSLRTDAALPWFVRTREYPGFGPAPFFEQEATLSQGQTMRLQCAATIADAP